MTGFDSVFLLLLMFSSPVQEQLAARVARSQISPELKGSVQAAVADGKFTEAEKTLVAESHRSPANPEVLSLAATIFLADNQPLNAAVALKKAEKLRALSIDERFTLSMAYVAMKHPEWARSELDQLARQNPRDSRYLYWLARIDYDQSKYAEAERTLRKVIEISPSSARAYDNLGLNLEALGRLDEALAAYKMGMEINRGAADRSCWAALNYGTLALKMGRLGEAKAALDEAVQLDSGSAQAHYRLGVWNEKSGESDAAIRELRTAASLDPKYPEPWWALARLLRHTGDKSAADAALARFQRLKYPK